MKTKLTTLLSLITYCSFSQSIPAEDSIAKELDQVIITGQYRPQSIRNSVYQVRTISNERIRQQGATKLQDLLKNELSFRFSQDMATGGSSITLNGLSGQNVKILIDGLPVTGRQGTSNEIDINQIDINSIEKIEIVEGPMSVVFGADALAGVINIITKKAAVSNFSVQAKVHEETVSNEYGIKQGIHNQFAGFTWKSGFWEVGAGIGRNYFGGWKDTAVERELVWHKKDQIVGNGFIGYRKGRLNIRYRFDGLDEIITNPGNFGGKDPNSGQVLAHDQEYLSQRLMQQIQGTYTVNNDLNFQLQSGYTTYSRQVYSTTLNKETGDVRLDPGSGKQSTIDFSGLTIRALSNYSVSKKLTFQPGVDINLERGKGERLEAGTNAVNDYAFFLTSEIIPIAGINLRPGLRIVSNSVYEAPPVIPSLNSKFVLGKHIDLRLSYARGFRAPSLRELYFNFVDASHLVFGNKDLKAETSHSLNASVTHTQKASKFVGSTILSGFYNKLNNQIDYAFNTGSDTARLVNIAKSKTAGGSLTHSITHKRWNLNAGFAYTGFFNSFSPSRNLPEILWSPEANLALTVRFPLIGMNMSAYYKITGRRPQYVLSGMDIILARTDGYQMADISLTKSAGRLITLNAGVRNLFDASRIGSSFVSGGVHSQGGLTIGTGRSYFLGIAFNWNQNNKQ